MSRKKKKIILRILAGFAVTFIALLLTIIAWYYFDTKTQLPDVDLGLLQKLQREKKGTDQYTVGRSWLKKNEYGLWEMYLEGNAFERGVAEGMLTKELIFKQEEAFVDQIREMIPSESYLSFLKYFIRFFNRDLDEYILPEFKEEIYGISFSASDQFDFIGTKYERMLNYHAAHDIGHALQNMMLVGCTSFGANMGYADSSLIVGRNFDFYINDKFAEDKIVCFEKPEKGFAFAYVTWASMIGVVSGMNAEGLTVTINAGKSEIPFKSATPISLLAREILQYASSIEEAIDIAGERHIFVSESILVSSAKDNKAVIIEKSPSKMGVYSSNEKIVVCANHFQSSTFSLDSKNRERILESTSTYRESRAMELILQNDTLDYNEAASVLRNRNGLNDKPIGIGNEKAMAQMISHHSVIFMPSDRKMWVSTQPYQLGKYLNYQLDSIFESPLLSRPAYDTTFTIEADTFLFSPAFTDYLKFRKEEREISKAMEKGAEFDIDTFRKFIGLNPEYYKGYVMAGDYYSNKGDYEKALRFYNFSLTKEFEKNSERRRIENLVEKMRKTTMNSQQE